MTIAELAIILRIKADGAEKLKAMDDGLKATAKSAKAAADAIKQTNDAIEDTRQQKFAFDSAANILSIFLAASRETSSLCDPR